MWCRYVYDKEAGRVLIPGCWGTVHSGDMEDCYCPKGKKSSDPKYQELTQMVNELHAENERLYNIIKELGGEPGVKKTKDTKIFKMNKKIILAICTILFIGSCDMPETKTIERGQSYGYGEVNIIIIDSCEYVRSKVHYGYSICHKGNCKFCQERQRN